MLINLNEIKNGSFNKKMLVGLVGMSTVMSSVMLKTSPNNSLIKASADEVKTTQQQNSTQQLSDQAKQQIKDQYNFDAVSAKTVNGNLILTDKDGAQLTISQPTINNGVKDVTAESHNDDPSKYDNASDTQVQQGNGQMNQTGDTNKNVDLNLPSDLSSVRSKIVDLAKSQLGVPYVWGGTSWGKGMDCSGFVQQVYKQVGINLPRTSQQQSAQLKVIPLSQAKPGDLVFWGGQGTAYHIAIYIGNNQIIEEPNPSQPCHIVHLYGNYQIGTLDGINK